MSFPFNTQLSAHSSLNFLLHASDEGAAEASGLRPKNSLERIVESAERLWGSVALPLNDPQRASLQKAKELATKNSCAIMREMEAEFCKLFEDAYELWQVSGGAHKDTSFPSLMDQFFLNPIFGHLAALSKVQQCFFNSKVGADPEILQTAILANPLACLLLNDKIENPAFKQLVIRTLVESKHQDIRRFLFMPLMRFPFHFDKKGTYSSSMSYIDGAANFMDSFSEISEERKSDLEKGYVWMVAIQEGWDDLLEAVIPEQFSDHVIHAEQFETEGVEVSSYLMEFGLTVFFFNNERCIEFLKKKGVWSKIKNTALEFFKARWDTLGNEFIELFYKSEDQNKFQILQRILHWFLEDAFIVDKINSWRKTDENDDMGLNFAQCAAMSGSVVVLTTLSEHNVLKDLVTAQHPDIVGAIIPNDSVFSYDQVNIAFAAAAHDQVKVLDWIKNHSDENISSLLTKVYQYKDVHFQIAYPALYENSTQVIMFLLQHGYFENFFKQNECTLKSNYKLEIQDKGNAVHKLFYDQKDLEQRLSLFKEFYQHQQLMPWLFETTEQGKTVINMLVDDGDVDSLLWLEEIGDLHEIVTPKEAIRCCFKEWKLNSNKTTDKEKEYLELFKRLALNQAEAVIEAAFEGYGYGKVFDGDFGEIILEYIFSTTGRGVFESLFTSQEAFDALIKKWIELGPQMNEFCEDCFQAGDYTKAVNLALNTANLFLLDQFLSPSILIGGYAESILFEEYLEKDGMFDEEVEVWILNAISADSIKEDLKSKVVAKFLDKVKEMDTFVAVYRKVKSEPIKKMLCPPKKLAGRPTDFISRLFLQASSLIFQGQPLFQ